METKRNLKYFTAKGISPMGIISLVGGRFDNSLLFLMEKIAISVILAVSLSLVVGFLGELSLGHAGFMCVGAYLGGKVAALLVPVLGNGILSFLVALLVGCGAPESCMRGNPRIIMMLFFLVFSPTW